MAVTRRSVFVAACVLFATVPARALDYELTVGGYIKLDALVTTTTDGRLGPANLGRDFYVPSLTPVAGEGGDPVFDMHPRQTRLSLKASAEVAPGEKVEGFVEVDFMVNPIGDERVSNSYAPRLRHAFVKYGGLLAGQTWSTFQDVATLPEALDFIGTTDGVVFARQAMIRYSLGGLDLALENPETTATPFGGGARLVTDDNYIPDLVCRYTLRGDWGHLSLAGIGRSLAIQDAGADGTTNALAGGGALGLKVLFASGDDVRMTAIAGSGLGRYLALNFANDAVLQQGGRPKGIPSAAGSLALRHLWSERWRSNVMASAIRVFNDTDLTGEMVSAWAAGGRVNLLYQPVDTLVLGVEYGYATREREDGERGQMHRLQMSAKLAL